MYFFSMLSFPAWSHIGVDIRCNLLEPTPAIQIRDLERQIVEELSESRSIWSRLSSCFSPRAKKEYSKPDASNYQWTENLTFYTYFPNWQRQYSTTNGIDDSAITDDDGRVAIHEFIFHQTDLIIPTAHGKICSVSIVAKSAEPHGMSTVNENGDESAPNDLITFPTKVLAATWPSDVQSPGGLTAFDDSYFSKPKSFDRDVDNSFLFNGSTSIKDVERPGLVPDLKRLKDVSLRAVHSTHPGRTKNSIDVKSLAALAASDSYRHVLSSL